MEEDNQNVSIAPLCPRGHGNMRQVNNDYGNVLYHQCKSCHITDEYPICISCNEEPSIEGDYCNSCLMDLIDDYSEYL